MNLNNSIFIFLITLFIPATLLLADIDVNNYGSEDIKEPTKQSPFSLTFSSDAIGQSKIQHGYFKGDELRFGEVTAEASAVFYYCPTHEEGASVSLSYTYTSFEWPQNLWFDQDHFNTAALSLTGFSHRLCRWFWIGQATVNVDADQWNFNTYAYYDLLLWGRYAYFENFGLNIGLFVQTGMRTDRLYPVIGIDWQISKRWKLNLVYPLNISLEYRLNNMWSVALAGRNFNYRYRVGPHECFCCQLSERMHDC